jgi:chemotaxis protein histidine kinase CheA
VGDDLLDMLAAETDRRGKAITSGLKALNNSGGGDPARMEALRVEAHGLKGAALVVGQERLAEVARLMEEALADSTDSGQIEPEVVDAILTGTGALQKGAKAAASGKDEPPAVGDALAALRA